MPPKKYRQAKSTKEKQIKKMIKQELTANRIFKPEIKYIDTGANGDFITSISTFYLLNAMVQGDTARSRIGAKVKMLGYEINGWCVTGSSPVGATDRINIGTFIDITPGGAAPTGLSVTVPSDSTIPYNSYSSDGVTILPNMLQKGVFSHLKNKKITINQNQANQLMSYPFYMRQKWPKGLISEYDNSNAGTIADFVKNALYFYTLGVQANVANVRSSLYFYARVYYVDI